MIFLKSIDAQSEDRCIKYSRPIIRYCKLETFDNDYYLSVKGINCTNTTHIAVFFSYNINNYLLPKGINAVLNGDSYSRIKTERFGSNVNVNHVLFIPQSSWPNNPELTLKFAILQPKCRGTRYQDPNDTHIMLSCTLKSMISCPDSPTTTIFSTESIVVNSKAEPTATLSLNTTVLTHNSLLVATIVALPVFAFIGLAIFCFIAKRNRRRKHSDKNDHLNLATIPKANNQILVPIKLFLIFVSDHQIHLNVVKNFVSFLQGDLGFQVFCEIFQTLEYCQDPVAWMDKCFNNADKVLVIWSHNAVSHWVQYNKEEPVYQDLFTPVLKHIHKDLFRYRNRGKYYFGFFDYFAKENIPREFINETNFRLMDEFEDLYYRLKSIELYVPGGEIKEERVMFNHYSSSQHNHHGSELHKAIREMNLFVKNSPDWYVQPCFASSSKLDQNIQLEINCNVLKIQPPSPIATDQNWFEENISPNDLALNNSMNNELLISDCSTRSLDSSKFSLIKNGNLDTRKEELVPHQHVDMTAIVSTANLQLSSSQTSSKQKPQNFLQSLPKQPASIDSGVDVEVCDVVTKPNIQIRKSPSITKLTLMPINLHTDPMSSLLTVNQISKSNDIILQSV